MRPQRLPYFETIQRSFGHHDIAGMQAHTGAAAAASAEAIGAEAFTRGSHLVFGRVPDLRTAAHEAAHAIQQRSGLGLRDGVGREGDSHERHAEQVADSVVRGGSAEGLLDRCPSPFAIEGPPAGVQRIVRKARNGKYHSTLDEDQQEFDTEEKAEELDRRLEVERSRTNPAVSQKLGEMDFTPPNLGEGRLSEAATPLALTLASHPAHFGPLMTQGGQVPTSAVSRAQGTALQAPGKDPVADTTYHSGQNTYAAVLGSATVAGVRFGESVAQKSGGVTPAAELSSNVAAAGREFRDQHIFQQGPIQEAEHVHLPPERTQAHAEAKAASSDAMTGMIKHAGNQLTYVIDAVGGAQDLATEPESEENQNRVYTTLGLAPEANVDIVTNRASCARGSGYKGGCNQENADLVPSHWQTHEANVGEERAAMHRHLHMMNFGMSVAGPYRKGGDPRIPIQAGLDVAIHNQMSWDPGSEGKLKPLNQGQKAFMAETALARAEHDKYESDVEPIEEHVPEPKATARKKPRAKEPSAAGTSEALPWGGTGPDSTVPYQNWGTNHPLHRKRSRDDDATPT